MGEQNTVVSKEDTMQVSEDDSAPLGAGGPTLRSGEESSVLVMQDAEAGQERAARAREKESAPADEKESAAAGANGSAPVSEEKLLVVIPAYNEAGRVGAVVGDVRRTLPEADVLVIDDGSEDATATEAVRAGAIALSLPTNGGYGTALQTGYKYAVRHGYTLVGQIDADGQHRAEYLSAMLDCIREDRADVVVGSRFLAKDGHYQTPFARSLGIRLFARVASMATGQLVTDPTSGFQMMRIEIARLFSRDVFPVDYPDADILILLHRTGYRVRELPVQMRPSPGSSMHSTQSTPYYVYKMLLSIFVTLLRPHRKVMR
jgi:glycosyltransferase involved in cell wall biosynthesis